MQPMTPVNFRSAPLHEPAPRRDPAPSRWGYRYQRLMLTPLFRQIVRIGLPAALLAVIASVWFGNPGNREQVVAMYQGIRSSIEQRPEFMVTAMAIDGADDALAADIRTVLPVNFPVSSFDLDLDAMHETVQAVGGVAEATIRVRSGGILQVDVIPRVPVAILRRSDGLWLVDGQGFVVAPILARNDRADLPLIAGDGAREMIVEALDLTATFGPIASRVRGLVRMGERRWDVVLDREQRIQLPAQDPVHALERVVVMAQTQDILERDVVLIDMRNASRPTIRLGDQATVEMRRINASVSGTGN